MGNGLDVKVSNNSLVDPIDIGDNAFAALATRARGESEQREIASLNTTPKKIGLTWLNIDKASEQRECWRSATGVTMIYKEGKGVQPQGEYECSSLSRDVEYGGICGLYVPSYVGLI